MAKEVGSLRAIPSGGILAPAGNPDLRPDKKDCHPRVGSVRSGQVVGGCLTEFPAGREPNLTHAEQNDYTTTVPTARLADRNSQKSLSLQPSRQVAPEIASLALDVPYAVRDESFTKWAFCC